MDHLIELKEAASNGKLIAIVGAGVSIALANTTTPSRSWPELLRRAFSFANQSGSIDNDQQARWLNTLNAGDIDELLGAAEFVSKKLGGRKGIMFSRWLENEFSRQKINGSSEMKSSMMTMHRARVPICTLNYDSLIEKVTKSNSITMNDVRSVLAWTRRESTDILHLHGLWSAPETVVLGISDYNDALSDEFRLILQKSFSTFSRIVFIGCGETLYDPNFAALLAWMRSTLGASAQQHYALVRNAEVDVKLRDQLWQGLVHPIGYGDQYTDLPKFLADNFTPTVSARRQRNRGRSPDAEVIRSYRRQIIIDSGKMTIEGVRADADTAKQKFDLEKLFVPLSVLAVPPDFAPNDPDREQKLKEWHSKNSETLPFGEALRANNHLALLALPGGGKTLLLKRLAVAYADPDRQNKTDDLLPDIDLLPILIRCREWRNYITLPISSMISKMFEINGNEELRGLFEALGDRLKTGNVLLLVDGLDEIHSDSDRTIFVDNLEAFLDNYKKIRLVVTSREAGFALVAPSLMRFCTRWRIASLTEETINLLCSHWHALMGASIGNAEDETREVVQAISQNSALQRLAENPLLLTMLLVVKHGYGRLPPDRVTLYDRAVEVLLDTWNIHGHSALNPREAVPQLAYVAYRLMEQGRQTATESELLALIEECRREVPLVRLYAKDSPSEFLKRVELRSSLLLEAGKSPEGGKLVSFYQFRHLTFQEYMAAIAVVDGHYSGYSESDVALLPIIGKVVSDEWKEVVPMAAVLAKKRSSNIINELILISEREERSFLSGGYKDDRFNWSSGYRLPPSISRLTQCLIEETEITQTSLDTSARLISTFAHGCQSQENWSALLRGPFGQTIYSEAWRLFESGRLPRQSWIRNTVALMAVNQKGVDYWWTNDGLEEIREKLGHDDVIYRSNAAAIVCGMFWQNNPSLTEILSVFQPYLEANIIRDEPPYSIHAIWALGMLFSRRHEMTHAVAPLSVISMEKLRHLWFDNNGIGVDIVPFTMSVAPLLSREDWVVNLAANEKAKMRRLIYQHSSDLGDSKSPSEAALTIFYYAKSKVKKELAKEIIASRSAHEGDEPLLYHFGLSDDEVFEIISESRRQEGMVLRSGIRKRAK